MLISASISFRTAPGVTLAQEPKRGHPTHSSGVCATSSILSASGIFSPAPGCPACAPGLRPVFSRLLTGRGFRYPSDEGGLELFCEFLSKRDFNSAMTASFSARSLRVWATNFFQKRGYDFLIFLFHCPRLLRHFFPIILP